MVLEKFRQKKLTPTQREAARKLMADSDMTIPEIAEEIGVNEHQLRYLKNKTGSIGKQAESFIKMFETMSRAVDRINQSAINQMQQKLEFQNLQQDMMGQVLDSGEEDILDDDYTKVVLEMVKPYMPQIMEKFFPKEQQIENGATNGLNPNIPSTQPAIKTQDQTKNDFSYYLNLFTKIPDKLINKKTANAFIKSQKVDPETLKIAVKKMQKITKVI